MESCNVDVKDVLDHTVNLPELFLQPPAVHAATSKILLLLVTVQQSSRWLPTLQVKMAVQCSATREV